MSTHSFKSFKGLVLSISVLLFFLQVGYGQEYARFKADFTLKELSTKGDSLERRLVIGTCYYDNQDVILSYHLHFPHYEEWIIRDTNIYTIRDGELISQSTVPDITEHNVFKMLMENTFTEFGMSKSGYEIQNVKRLGDDVYVTYNPPEKHREVLGDLVLVKSVVNY